MSFDGVRAKAMTLLPFSRVCARHALTHPPVGPKKAIVDIVRNIIVIIRYLGQDMIAR